ncbi:uncharacterized protein cfap97d2 [Dunckerocampus dactyliophorus]|uniref:uncharacterized protein cfap97d2 n=1 Tax=Dunckerocampus dactyliophorus TaxID=161453 RepID=UPI002404DDEC|nr:uncharacterized protein cfap97d2 [Dunckerocampus dactyliophorus]
MHKETIQMCCLLLLLLPWQPGVAENKLICWSFLRGGGMNTFSCRCSLLQTSMSMLSHLAYQPVLPSGNKYLQQKWDPMSYDLHRRKLKTMKPTVDTTAPKTYKHLSLRLKILKSGYGETSAGVGADH